MESWSFCQFDSMEQASLDSVSEIIFFTRIVKHCHSSDGTWKKRNMWGSNGAWGPLYGSSFLIVFSMRATSIFPDIWKYFLSFWPHTSLEENCRYFSLRRYCALAFLKAHTMIHNKTYKLGILHFEIWSSRIVEIFSLAICVTYQLLYINIANAYKVTNFISCSAKRFDHENAFLFQMKNSCATCGNFSSGY